ncbi:hypothetical protein PDE_06222 [Penicillium oxalicum 114-2]|uniref:Yippee domain-containing protein n=1 Tax=Penicillium oxalicum (strain 114-2 / CGMCC 5302) TaxID=933388 RepID=S8B930_PENO1|nr:hypothetical protein PDE_06222 [Penicillium oxalicum 114-2]
MLSMLFPQYLIPSFLPNSSTPKRNTLSPSPSPVSSPTSPVQAQAQVPPPGNLSTKGKGKKTSLQRLSPTTSKSLTHHTSYIHCITCGAHLCFTSQIISKGFTGRHGRAYLVCAQSTSPDPHEQALRKASPPSALCPSQATQTLPNTLLHRPVSRQLVTGAHTVSDISCLLCGIVLGWKYVEAEEETQRYKVGKFILETKKITTATAWEGVGESGESDGGRQDAVRSRRYAGRATSLDIENGDGDDDGGHHLDGDEREKSKNSRGRGDEGEHDHHHHSHDPNYDYGHDHGNEHVRKQERQTGMPGREIEFDSQDEDECEDLFAGIWSPGLATRRRSRKIEKRPSSMAATMFGFA